MITLWINTFIILIDIGTPNFVQTGFVNLALKLKILRKASIRRVWNLWSVLGSYWLSRVLRKPLHCGYPVSLSIEPTTACNLRCPQCPSGLRSFNRPTGHLQMHDFQSWLPKWLSHIWYLNFYFQGEPFLNEEVYRCIRLAHAAGVFTSTSTNGHYLTPMNCEETVLSGLDQLTVSVDGVTQDIYELYRVGGQLEKVKSGIQNLVTAKRQLKKNNPHIVFQFLVIRDNVHQMEAAKNLAKELHCDEIRFKTAQVYDFNSGSGFIPETEVYSRYKKNSDGSYAIDNKFSNHCWRMWSSPVITWDGRVVPCCFDKDANHVLGNLNDKTLAEIWKDKDYADFRNQVWKERSGIEICKNCTEGTKVWI